MKIVRKEWGVSSKDQASHCETWIHLSHVSTPLLERERAHRDRKLGQSRHGEKKRRTYTTRLKSDLKIFAKRSKMRLARIRGASFLGVRMCDVLAFHVFHLVTAVLRGFVLCVFICTHTSLHLTL